MKILVLGDPHGTKPRIHFKDFDAIVCTGDFCSDKGFRPLKNQWVKALDKDPENTPSLGTFILEKIGKKKERQLVRDSLKAGRKILEFLNSFGKPVFIVPGNWDESYGNTQIKDLDKNDYNYFKAFLDFYRSDKTNIKLTKGLKNIKDCQFKIHKFNGVNFLGYGLSSSCIGNFLKRKREFNKKQFEILKRAYSKLKKKLVNVYKKRDKKSPTIFLTHNVPYNTPLDILKLKGSKINGKHLGSTIAREFCNKYQPLICVGGHIHEHFKKCKIKKTTAINVGFGKDANILIELDEKKGKIKKIEFYRGYKGIK